MGATYSCERKIVGNFGFPVWENPTEAMVQAAFDHHRLRYRYVTTEVPPGKLADAVKGARAMGYRGFNCTLPHKVAVIDALDGLGESARLIGAVNCVVERDGKYVGENTDGKGFLESLRTVRDPKGRRILILGAGGAARAIAVELALAGAASIAIVNRSVGRGRELADLVRGRTAVACTVEGWKGDHKIPPETDVVVNATSIGLFPDTSRVPVDVSTFRPGLIVADVIPNPPRTRFLKEAEAAGAIPLDGLGMLVNQGRLGIRYWTGVDPDEAAMRRTLEGIFG